jgi:hypothetical protein
MYPYVPYPMLYYFLEGDLTWPDGPCKRDVYALANLHLFLLLEGLQLGAGLLLLLPVRLLLDEPLPLLLPLLDHALRQVLRLVEINLSHTSCL